MHKRTVVIVGQSFSDKKSMTMKRKLYCCDVSRQIYEDHYKLQVGGELCVLRYDITAQTWSGQRNRRTVLTRGASFRAEEHEGYSTFSEREQKDDIVERVENEDGSRR